MSTVQEDHHTFGQRDIIHDLNTQFKQSNGRRSPEAVPAAGRKASNGPTHVLSRETPLFKLRQIGALIARKCI